MDLSFVESGTITQPRGWRAGAAYAGIKTYGDEPRLDVALLCSDRPTLVAGVFTQNAVCGAAVDLCRQRIVDGRGRALVVNSGVSNVAMGERGVLAAREMARLAALRLGVPEDETLVASTGVIGRPLPLDKLELGISAVSVTEGGGREFSRAIMTTDTVAKSAAVELRVGDRRLMFGGAAKGAGMAHPNMATVFCFLTTDAPLELEFQRALLRDAADESLNMMDIDMDTSTSDTMLLFANGAEGGDTIGKTHPCAGAVAEAVRTLAIHFAKELARDGEGATTLIEVTVSGARSLHDARSAARTIVSSPLVKTMVTGRDPNLGRLMMALGRSGATIELARTSIWLEGALAFERGAPTELPYEAISKKMNAPEVRLSVDLGLGTHTATAWGCDLTADYVRINADYTT